MILTEPFAQGLFLGIAAIALACCVLSVRQFRRQESPPKKPTQDAICIFKNGALAEANPEGFRLLSRASSTDTNWATLRDILKTQFPDFPQHQGTLESGELIVLTAAEPHTEALATIDQSHDTARVTVTMPRQEDRNKTPFDRSVLQRAPCPIWKCDEDGVVTWSNDAYNALAQQLGYPKTDHPTKLFDIRSPIDPTETQRLGLLQQQQKLTHWFDVTSVSLDDGHVYFAIDANTVVNAETAQRGVVQTVSRTFAQLPTGIAIFDRKHRLIVFNPSLTTLTAQSGAFLSSQPTILSFFDGLRECRIAPEPKGNQAWYAYVSAIINAIQQGRFRETWELPTGKSLRVTGIPQRSGALALLFDDVTTELRVTRRLRSDIATAHGALDMLDDPIALFAPTGTHIFCNKAYRKFWKCDPDTSLSDYTIVNAIALWETRFRETAEWRDFRASTTAHTSRNTWDGELVFRSQGTCRATLTPIRGGAVMVKFRLVAGVDRNESACSLQV